MEERFQGHHYFRSPSRRGLVPEGYPIRPQTSPHEHPDKLFLIVEDDEDDFILLERALNKLKVEAAICWAQDGAEALESLSRLSFQFAEICLVVDIQLPDMTGFELVEDLKVKGLCKNLVIAFLTGNPNPALKTRALGCGADAFFLKPERHSAFVDIAKHLMDLCSKVSA